MKNFTISINIKPEIYLKDPTSTDLGKKILDNGIQLIDELGFEDFNFKKLARKISSTESSIYRYFDNKHYLFIYLINWYWEWMSNRMDIALFNVEKPEKKIKQIIKTVIRASFINTDTPFIDEETLHRIMVREGAKAYHHKSVDNENAEGFFLSYKALCKKISNVFSEYNPNYKYPNSLASTLIDVCNNNIYYAKHLPRLTDINFDGNPDKMKTELFDMMLELIMNNLNANKKSQNKKSSLITIK